MSFAHLINPVIPRPRRVRHVVFDLEYREVTQRSPSFSKRSVWYRSYYAKHREKMVKRLREYYQRTREKRLAYQREYNERNRELVRKRHTEYMRVWRARKKAQK